MQWRSLQKSLFFYYREKSRKKMKRGVTALCQLLISIELSVRLISLAWCDAWAVLSVTLRLLPSRVTYLFLDSKAFSHLNTNWPTGVGNEGLWALPALCLLFIFSFSVILLRFVVSENIGSVSFSKVWYSLWKDLILIFFRTVIVICNELSLVCWSEKGWNLGNRTWFNFICCMRS